MKTYKNLYKKICSIDNLMFAYKKARKGKGKSACVIEFEKNIDEEIKELNEELTSFTYKPKPLHRFVIRDPKTRVIHASAFRDRVVHHALLNVIVPIFEKRFIFDSYASRVGKGTHASLQRFDFFKRRVSCNGRLIKRGKENGNFVEGYILKADVKHYFQTINHKILIGILRRKIQDEKTIWLVQGILENGDDSCNGLGMPLGNYTSQFFANVYLNELDYFVKHFLKARFYIRYVDDFVIFHKCKKLLEYYRDMIERYISCLKLELHEAKTKILPLCNGVDFVGYKVFYYYKKIRRRNIRIFRKNLNEKLKRYRSGEITKIMLIENLQGWFGYARWADTYKFRKKVLEAI